MADTITCSECGNEVWSSDDLEAAHEVGEMEVDDDGSIHLFDNRDLLLCKRCKNPLGVGR